MQPIKKLLFILLFLPLYSRAQFYSPGAVIDSTVFTFSTSDSLIHYVPSFFWSSAMAPLQVAVDTLPTTLWQIGNTYKSGFSIDSVAGRGIMTDTLNSYPTNANSSFILAVGALPNIIVSFWHNYQTDSLHAGGIVEFSTDSGSSWMNITACNTIATANFYSAADTIVSGQSAFTGNSNGERLSQFQITNCIADRTTATLCRAEYNFPDSTIYFRFRFVSDSTIDSLSGWMIDSIKVAYFGCGTSVSSLNVNNYIDVYPNPATAQLTISSSYLINSIIIINVLGQTVFSEFYNDSKSDIDISRLPAGLYFLKVNGKVLRKFMKE